MKDLPPPDGPQIPWNDFVRFAGQLSHDLRNHLNSIELQATLLAELADDPELKSEVKRLREMVSETGRALQKLTTTLNPPRPQLMPYRAADFIQDLRGDIATALPQENASIEWDVQLGDETMEIDPQGLEQAALELFTNAAQHARGIGNLSAQARIEAGRFILELREPKQTFNLPTENWGGTPLCSGKRGHYGLGLHHARVIVESQQGELRAQYDPGTSALITTISVPLVQDAG